jgi:molybdopterin adenylyltransferase
MHQAEFHPLAIAILTISDTRTAANDTSGDALARLASAAGHRLVQRALIKDDIYALRAQVSLWIADPSVQVILCTGGTGFTGRDSTPEALMPLLDKTIPGFGELFRARSEADIGTSTMQSRAFAGMSNRTLLFALPGSTRACELGFGLIAPQLDSRTQPCNFYAQVASLANGLTAECPTRG